MVTQINWIITMKEIKLNSRIYIAVQTKKLPRDEATEN